MKIINLFNLSRKTYLVVLLLGIVFLIFLLVAYMNDFIPSSYFQKNKSGKLAIIIDDFGQSREGVQKMMSIDRHLTFAVMPFMEYTKQDAVCAKAKGYEVIVHLSMEPEHGKISWLGPKPILCGMDDEKVKEIVSDAFDDVPFAIGCNIHMGSKASCQEGIMTSVLDVVKERGVYFVDSRTGRKPVAKRIADENGIICYENNIFLDGQKPKSHIKKQLKKAGDIALKKGKAIAIGHVGVEGGDAMAEAIMEMIDELEEKNVELVFVSELISEDMFEKDNEYFANN